MEIHRFHLLQVITHMRVYDSGRVGQRAAAMTSLIMSSFNKGGRQALPTRTICLTNFVIDMNSSLLVTWKIEAALLDRQRK